MKIVAKIIPFLLLLRSVSGQTEVVQIVSDMYTEEILPEPCFRKVKDLYELRIADLKYTYPLMVDRDEVKRFVVFNNYRELARLVLCPPEKKVLFMMEPFRISPEEAEAFSRIYTWDDEAIDNEKFFKFYFPDLMPMADKLIPFEDRKLCTMVVRNWSGEHRRRIVEFFAGKPKGEFTFYGSVYPNIRFNKFYGGVVPGLNSGKEKIETLKNYRFCICFENQTNLNGYVTEKIFSCFAAGCIPVYFGAPDIERYIPKNCFIDYRDFASNEELYQFMKEMTEKEHEKYLESIRLFLNSDEARVFSPEYFAETLYESVSW